ncbi:LysR family transcriptional regulator [Halomonas litopenaei]|uniref:LysR family transcriptional regulator n=1 Tax=Halomonas litopenaei TaxID=2109328 RepID=A0ABX5IUA7_9GAMM|nr:MULTISPECIES: LysR family transcriptional regulator [Halomonas]PTL90642.1 LysR family transcriptional regulator [Halomonas sp. SYSU XM8]PTL94137.1 LysR family transcriptional regulator [Halomonas litopenaei]USZ51231.1 LysR family transcriptional regulator [Halomonas sp. DN3]
MEAYQALLARLRYKHLLMIATLGRRKNLHQTADAMHMSQPAATRMLGEIERAFGCQLFKRTSRGMLPTSVGEMLIDFADNALARLDRCAEEVRRHQLGGQGQLVLGAIMGAAPDLVADAIIALKRDRPLLQIRLMGETSDQLAELLDQGKIELAIARYTTASQHNAFDFEALGEETLLTVVRRGHPLLEPELPPLSALLDDWPWLLQPLSTPARQAVEKAFEVQGLVSPRDVIECGSIFAALQLVQRSDCLMVMSESVLSEHLAMGHIQALPLSLGRTLAPYGLMTRKGSLLSEPARALCERLRTLAGRARPGDAR